MSPGSSSTKHERTDRIKVAIIDDSVLVREALSRVLGDLPDMQIVSVEASLTETLVACEPQVLLLDVGLRDRDSLAVATALQRELPQLRIIVMDLLPVNEDIREFVNAGVAAFVLKDASLIDFEQTIRAVAAGETVLPPRMTESLFAQIMREADAPARAETRTDARMTARELQVIGIIGEGLSNKEIAYRLNIATHTVKSHVRNVMEKLALHTRLQIAAYAHRDRSL